MESRPRLNVYLLMVIALGGIALTGLCLGACLVTLLSPNPVLHLRWFEVSVERHSRSPTEASIAGVGPTSMPPVTPPGLPTNTPPTTSYWAPATSQRLGVRFRGADGFFGVGRGCPGRDGLGQVEAYHLVVRGVDPHREVGQILLAGDNHTNWARFCTNQTWELVAQNRGDGTWDL
ncbi:hypothetical protein QYE77_08155 [Thermanaerothrix sp. 4228-RoL]|uniref:Uncharacterized protein n=1 Tax=Thermanaerothrix solaris TaxID=3058434 RepID=A0ABU3NN18_9CHLR|nr:hypothetical protein [Thermanaerothrix sp. 4228-RoL]MDT8898239.1 hypothetical protein [Thermanaerothrix sp. 4228-RoL]